MAIELRVDGYFNMEINNVHTGEQVEKDIEQGILDNLQQGEYVISLENKQIVDINDLSTPLYSFNLNVQDSTEYEFENVDED